MICNRVICQEKFRLKIITLYEIVSGHLTTNLQANFNNWWIREWLSKRALYVFIHNNIFKRSSWFSTKRYLRVGKILLCITGKSNSEGKVRRVQSRYFTPGIYRLVLLLVQYS